MKITSKIEESRRDQVYRSITEVLSGKSIDSIDEIKSGYSNSITLRIKSQGKVYICRIMDLSQPLEDRTQQVFCWDQASKFGVSPRVYLGDPAKGVLIMDYIEHSSPKDPNWVSKLADLLRSLHDLPLFPKYLGPFDYLTGSITSLRGEELPHYIERAVDQLEKLKHWADSKLVAVSCHNDLNYLNILWQNERPYLIDFEAATQGDAYFDLATLITSLKFSRNEEDRFLTKYLESDPTIEQCKKIDRMKQLSYGYYATNFIVAARNAGVPFIQESDIDVKLSSQLMRTGMIPAEWMSYGVALLKAANLEEV